MAIKPMPPVIQAKTDMMGWWRHDRPWDERDEQMFSMYLHRDAARAWQAFRDWCDGTPEQWRKLMGSHVRKAWLSGRQYGWEDV